jgi:transposase
MTEFEHVLDSAARTAGKQLMCLAPFRADGETFRIYVEKVLAPTLQAGEIVIMDNLGSHKGKAVRQLIRAAGAKLFFLPKYSPDLWLG